jgi:hypothetical protein
VLGDAGEMGTSDSILNLKCSIQAGKFRWLTQKSLWPLWGHMAHVENHCTRGWGVFMSGEYSGKDYIEGVNVT